MRETRRSVERDLRNSQRERKGRGVNVYTAFWGKLLVIEQC